MKLTRSRAGYTGLIFICLTGLAVALRLYLFKITEVNMFRYQVTLNPECFSVFWCAAAGLPALLFLSPLCIRNHINYGTWNPSGCLGGFNLL